MKSAAKGWLPNHCVFCGLKPRGKKTKEHIVPRWLSLDSGKDDEPAFIENFTQQDHLHFKNLTLPACESCNHGFSKMEGEAKRIFRDIRSGFIIRSDVRTLFDWFDKTRVALWLYYLSVNRSEHNIEPRFTASDRIGGTDRFLWLSLLPNSNVRGVGLAGVETEAFRGVPSTMGLLFRDVAIMNTSAVACAGDFFGFTKPEMATLINGHPALTRSGGETIKITPPEHECRIASTCLFEFGPQMKAYIGDLSEGTPYMVLDGKIVEPTEDKILIPRSSYGEGEAKYLWSSSVYEIQKKNLDEFYWIPRPVKEVQSIRASRLNLDSRIDEAILLANKFSLVVHKRVSPRTL